tara:strand:- start:451 stop:729 length:279 start_codon:yes stop_codon:yes gene_type:complete
MSRTIRSLGDSLNLEDFLTLYAKDFIGRWKRVHQVQVQGDSYYDFGEGTRQVEGSITYSRIFGSRQVQEVFFSISSEEDWLSKKYQITSVKH